MRPVTDPGPDQSFPRQFRLTSRRQFREVYNSGCRVGSTSLAMFGLPNSLGHCRLGVTVTRKVGGAVVRTRAKRLVREVFRRNRWRMHASIDLVVNVHRGLTSRSVAEIQGEFLACFDRLVKRMPS